MTRTRPDRLRIALMAALVLSLPTAGEAQINRDPGFIRQQLEQGVALQKKALTGLSDTGEALRLTWDAYVQIRAAHGNIEAQLRSSKFPNPMWELASTKIQTAREHLLQARDALKTPNRYAGTSTTPEAEAATHLQQSVHILQLVLVTAF